MAANQRSTSDVSAPSLPEMLSRQGDYWSRVYRRTWKGSVITSFVQPWLYIAAMGVVLGGYVDDAANQGLGGASYLDFIAPGLLAAQAMQVGTSEFMWPVMGALKWDRTYYSMIATPLRVVDIVAGQITFVLFRVASTCVVFCIVLAIFGIFTSVTGALACLLCSILTGMAIGIPVYAYTVGALSEQGFALIYRLGVMPMFLFSGAFFPIQNLPEVLQWVARLTPLWHGVELCRMGSLSQWDGASALVHLTYLGALTGLGIWLTVRRLTKRLVV